MNQVTLIGNLGKDPDVRTVGQNDRKVATFSLATNERYKDKSGEWQDATEWHNIVMWGNVAGVAQNYLSKGDKIAVTGKIQTRSYDKDGEKKYITEVVVNTMEMIITKGKKEEASSSSDAPPPQVPF